jgi:outer membrane lipoprotein-sorting protein
MLRDPSRLLSLVFLLTCLMMAPGVKAQEADSTAAAELPDPHDLVAAAIDLTRGLTSYAEMTMIVKRPEWTRESSLVAWTRGREDALIRFTAPARDAGNATLKQGEKMWTFTPKLNRTIRLPYSLMSQSWAGSDFSYNDLSRTDALLKHYDLKIVEVSEDDGHRVYTIDAIPTENSPVVWGKEQLVLRDDNILLKQVFYDQALMPLKQMESLEIGDRGGRTISTRMRMSNLDEPEKYTEIAYAEAQFDIEIQDSMFTQFSLQAGGRR